MTARLAAGVMASSLLRRVTAAGGAGAVLARGDADAGTILLVLSDRGSVAMLLERRLVDGDRYGWAPAGPSDRAKVDEYVARRRSVDADLWVIELDIVGVERFAEELIAAD